MAINRRILNHIDNIWKPTEYRNFHDAKTRFGPSNRYPKLYRALKSVCEKEGVKLLPESSNSVLGQYDKWYKTIILNRQYSSPRQTHTFLHEVAHAVLDLPAYYHWDWEGRYQEEVQAETITSIVWEELEMGNRGPESQAYIECYLSWLSDFPDESRYQIVEVSDYIIRKVKEF